jgi:hypothetical protein
MAEYKVPQDVEADDKLIGPFSFRQFIYLIVMSLSIAAAWGLSKIFIPLSVIPLPFIIFFGALALPLRKDQPMEIFLAAVVSFYVKPRKRKWDPDGIDSLIEITAPKIIEVQRAKDLSQDEAERRLSYLAEIVDSRGWAVRSPNGQVSNTSMNSTFYLEAQSAPDIMDGDMTQMFDNKLSQSNDRLHQEAIDYMHKLSTDPQPADDQQDSTTFDKPLEYNPYPEDMHQAVIQPINDDAHRARLNDSDGHQSSTSENTVSADIINLAHNTDLSIATIAREANRIREKGSTEEVLISLR